VEFLRNAPEGTYDAIIVDSSDPIGEFMLQWIVFLDNSTIESFSYVLVLHICSVIFFFASSYIVPELHAYLFLLGYDEKFADIFLQK
jgi:hypothetical protein